GFAMLHAKLVADETYGPVLTATRVYTPETVLATAQEPAIVADERSAAGLIELILKDPARLDKLCRDAATPPVPVLTRFLFIAQASYLLFGVAMVIILASTPADAYPRRWLPVPAV